MKQLFDPVDFRHGRAMKNRFMLSPLTNCQSHDDGTLSEDEYRWLTMRAEGGFGLTMTCASHVQARGAVSPDSWASTPTRSSTVLPALPRRSGARAAWPWRNCTTPECGRLRH